MDQGSESTVLKYSDTSVFASRLNMRTLRLAVLLISIFGTIWAHPDWLNFEVTNPAFDCKEKCLRIWTTPLFEHRQALDACESRLCKGRLSWSGVRQEWDRAATELYKTCSKSKARYNILAIQRFYGLMTENSLKEQGNVERELNVCWNRYHKVLIDPR